MPLGGRDEDVRALQKRVLAATRGLLTLTGAGGSGKTSLALDVAAGLPGEFREGIWLVRICAAYENDAFGHFGRGLAG